MRTPLLALALCALSHVALAQQDDEDEPVSHTPDEGGPMPLRARFGTDRAQALMRLGGTLGDGEQVRRGLARAAATGTPEAVAALVTQAASGTTPDELTLIDLARALAPFAAQPGPRDQLLRLFHGAIGRSRTSLASGARMELARQIAARGLVASHERTALDAMFALAREGSGVTQQMAVRALASEGVSAPTAEPTTAAGAFALAQTGDLRALDLLLAKAKATTEAPTRAACLIALGELGDGRARLLAIEAFRDPDPLVRAAAGETLVLLDAPERFHAVTNLLGGEDTAAAGVRLAFRVQDLDVVKALAARLKAVSDVRARAEVVAALGRGVATDEGLKVLVATASDPRLGGDAVHALARSPNAAAMRCLEELARQGGAMRRLAVRGYVLRAYVRRERSSALDDEIDRLAASREPVDRALGAFARVTLGRDAPSAWLDHTDAAVRRAAAMGSLAAWDGRTLPAASALLARYAHETDGTTRAVLAAGLLEGDPSATVPTLTLLDRVEAGSADAMLSALALARRKGDSIKDKITTLLASPDAVMRAHIARGLAGSAEPSATGWLAEAARYEAEPLVRAADVMALTERPPAPVRSEVLKLCARFDPEAQIRDIAARAVADAAQPAPWPIHELAWLHVVHSEGPLLATYVTSEGLAVPVAFDADGYALVPGVPPGDGRVILAPVLPGPR